MADYAFERLQRDYERSLLATLLVLSSIDRVAMGQGDGRGVRLMDAWIQRLVARLRGVDLDTVL